MPEIEFTINNETGEMEMRIEGVKGPACADIADKVKEVMGAPAREENTPEYHVRAHTSRQVKGQGGN